MEQTLDSREAVQSAVSAALETLAPDLVKEEAPEAVTEGTPETPENKETETPEKEEPKDELPEMNHGEKSWAGKLKAEEARLQAMKAEIEQEREKLKAEKPEVKEETKPETKQEIDYLADFPPLDPEAYETPEVAEAYNKLAQAFSQYRKDAEAKHAHVVSDLLSRLDAVEKKSEIAGYLFQERQQQLMEREAERAIGLFSGKYQGVELTPDEVWKAAAAYAQIDPDFDASDQSHYTDGKWVEIIERYKAPDILARLTAKEKEAKQETPLSPPVTASGTQANTLPTGDAPLLSRSDTRDAIKKLLVS